LSIRHPGFLDESQDLVVGVFGANAQSNPSGELSIECLEATVWAAANAPLKG